MLKKGTEYQKDIRLQTCASNINSKKIEPQLREIKWKTYTSKIGTEIFNMSLSEPNKLSKTKIEKC